MAKKNKGVGYVEPASYIPEELQKEFKVGKYYDGESIFPPNEKEKKTVSNKEFKDFLKKK